MDLKCALNPDLAEKAPWDEVDWDRPIGVCTCEKGFIEPGILPIKCNLTTPGDYNFVSTSLAINPSQAAAHKKLYPDVDIHANGSLEFKSVRSHDKYLDKTGFVKQPKKEKPRGTTK